MSEIISNGNVTIMRRRSDLHIARKFYHTCSGLFGLFVYKYFSIDYLVMGKSLISLAIVIYMLEQLRIRSASLNDSVLKVMGKLMRESERNRVSGFPYYAMGAGLSLILFGKEIGILAILFLIFSDPISSLVGVRYGKHSILPNKSLEGSMAGMFVCTFIAFTYCFSAGASGQSLIIFSIMAGVLGSFSELLSVFNMDDNFTIPIFSGLGLFVLNQLFQVF